MRLVKSERMSSSLPLEGDGIIRSKIFQSLRVENQGSLKRKSNYPRNEVKRESELCDVGSCHLKVAG